MKVWPRSEASRANVKLSGDIPAKPERGLFILQASHYSAFTETGATQTMKTNQKAEVKQ